MFIQSTRTTFKSNLKLVENNFKLVGLSNDRVRLIHSEKEIKVFVRKTADQGNQSNRLKRQYKLLEEWSNNLISVPKLFKNGITSKSEYFFEMEYINAPSLAHLLYYPTKNNILKMDFAYQRLVSYFEISLKEQILPNKNEVIHKIYKKLKLLITFFKKFTANELNPEIIYMILDLEINLKKSNLFSNIEGDSDSNLLYKVHGDLTLSNLLVGENYLYFIDLNEHFLGNTILSDISKIMFDLDFNLSLKLESKDLKLDLSTLNLATNLKNKFFELFKNHINFMLKIEDLLLIIESMRVLQYVLLSNISLSNNLQIYIIEKFKSLKNKNILCKL